MVGYQVQGRKAGTTNFRSTQTTGLSYNVNSLQPSTGYQWYVRAKCTDGSITGFTPLDNFTTLSARLESPELPSMELSPNPTTGEFTVQIEHVDGQGQLSIQNLLGETLWTNTISGQGTTTVLVNANLSPGMYLVHLRTDHSDAVQRLVVSQ